MIQFNLLPDVKQQFIKARRAKRMVGLIAMISAVAAVGLLAIMLSITQVAQKAHLKALNGDIKKYSEQLQNIPDLNKILTIQNQLISLPDLHAQKPVSSRLFGYLTQTTPTNVSLNHVSVDFENSNMQIEGSADKLETVNKFVDTLKFTDFQADGETKRAFTSVVLSSFGRDDKVASLQLEITFDPAIFSGSQDIKLNVPKIISTRSETEQPSALFNTTGQ